MTHLVLDASVAAKWFLPAAGEPFAENALHLLEEYRDGELQLFIPSLFWAELANVLWVAARHKRCSLASAEKALATALELGLVGPPTATLAPRALALAARFRHSVYDCIYVAAAEVLGCDLITADERLARALASYLPIRWLGAWR